MVRLTLVYLAPHKKGDIVTFVNFRYENFGIKRRFHSKQFLNMQYGSFLLQNSGYLSGVFEDTLEQEKYKLNFF